jgi:hypothetical protein
LFVARNFAVQQHGTFDMAFALESDGRVHLITDAKPEQQAANDDGSPAPARVEAIGEFWLPERSGCEWDPAYGFPEHCLITDMAFDTERFLAYAAAGDTLFTIDLQQMVYDFCSEDDYTAIYPIVGKTPLQRHEDWGIDLSSYDRIELSHDGQYLFVGDNQEERIHTLALNSNPRGKPKAHDSLTYPAIGKVATCA